MFEVLEERRGKVVPRIARDHAADDAPRPRKPLILEGVYLLEQAELLGAGEGALRLVLCKPVIERAIGAGRDLPEPPTLPVLGRRIPLSPRAKHVEGRLDGDEESYDTVEKALIHRGDLRLLQGFEVGRRVLFGADVSV